MIVQTLTRTLRCPQEPRMTRLTGDSDWVHDRYENDDGQPARHDRRAPADFQPITRGARQDPGGTTVRIDDLDYDVTEEDLMTIGTKIGQVVSVKILYDRMDRSEGTAFVTFEHNSDAQEAAAVWNGMEANHQSIKVTLLPSAPAASAPRPLVDRVQRPERPVHGGRSLFDRITGGPDPGYSRDAVELDYGDDPQAYRPDYRSDTRQPYRPDYYSDSHQPHRQDYYSDPRQQPRQDNGYEGYDRRYDRPRSASPRRRPPPPADIDRYAPSDRRARSRSPTRSRQPARPRARSPTRRRPDPRESGRRPEARREDSRRGARPSRTDEEGRPLVGGRPRKTADELDAEMEGYWAAKAAAEAEEANENGTTAAPKAAPAPATYTEPGLDDDIDMIE
ncbi:uncharacterized protein LTR77_005183 [Saxophila tyrrhenica]|uniref:RRM domain-containing protein n=1 Tax=Saxophila tyrrhenica TaxID=1690608 RepID=A0AAV9PB50_9PEZI|nr:hypothetical protein LTR77_005183 [Saxophila tyrrhenica]